MQENCPRPLRERGEENKKIGFTPTTTRPGKPAEFLPAFLFLTMRTIKRPLSWHSWSEQERSHRMLLTVLVGFYSLVTLLGRVAWLRGLARALASRLFGQHPPGYRRAAPPSRTFSRAPPKPEWVRQE